MAKEQSHALDFPTNEETTESAKIRQDIAVTRSELDETIDALGNRLKPKSMFRRHVLESKWVQWLTQQGPYAPVP